MRFFCCRGTLGMLAVCFGLKSSQKSKLIKSQRKKRKKKRKANFPRMMLCICLSELLALWPQRACVPRRRCTCARVRTMLSSSILPLLIFCDSLTWTRKGHKPSSLPYCTVVTATASPTVCGLRGETAGISVVTETVQGKLTVVGCMTQSFGGSRGECKKCF